MQFTIGFSKHGVVHYENTPCNDIQIFVKLCRSKIFSGFFLYFLISSQNLDCGYTLEPPRRGSSNEYPKSMFWSKNKKNKYTPVLLYKSGVQGVCIMRPCYPDGIRNPLLYSGEGPPGGGGGGGLCSLKEK